MVFPSLVEARHLSRGGRGGARLLLRRLSVLGNVHEPNKIRLEEQPNQPLWSVPVLGDDRLDRARIVHVEGIASWVQEDDEVSVLLDRAALAQM